MRFSRNDPSDAIASELADLREGVSRLTQALADMGQDRARGVYSDARDAVRARAKDAGDGLDSARGMVNARLKDAQDTYSDAREAVVSRAHDLADRGRETLSDAQDRFTEASGTLEHAIEENPFTAVAIAGVVGLVIGLFSLR